jgi:large subunit ribosomal protein L25
MNQSVLNAAPRNDLTKGELRTFRVSGKIPAVIYGGGESATAILLDEKDFLKATSGVSESTIISLDVGGKKMRAFVKERQRDPVSGKIIHVDFLEVVKGRSIHARVPLHLVGTPIGVREGGILENPAHEIEVECDPSVLPERIEIDVSELQANHSIHVRDIAAIAGVKVLASAELVVASVKYAKIEVEPVVEVTPEAEAAAAAAAAAAGAAPGAAPAAGAPGAAPAAGAAPGAAPAAGADKKAEKK